MQGMQGIRENRLRQFSASREMENCLRAHLHGTAAAKMLNQVVAPALVHDLLQVNSAAESQHELHFAAWKKASFLSKFLRNRHLPSC